MTVSGWGGYRWARTLNAGRHQPQERSYVWVMRHLRYRGSPYTTLRPPLGLLSNIPQGGKREHE